MRASLLWRCSWLLCALILVCSESKTVSAEPEKFFGPLAIENQYPFAHLYTGSAPDNAKPLSEGVVRSRIAYDWSNTSTYQRHYTTDVEIRAALFQFNYGASDKVEFGLGIPVTWRGGGTLDDFIKDWHKTFRLPEGRRPDVDDNQYLISGVDEDGNAFDYHKEGTALGKVWLLGKYLLHSDKYGHSEASKALSFRAGLPTAPNGAALEGIEFVPTVLYSEEWHRTALYSGLSWIYHSDTHVAGIPFSRSHLELFSQLEYLLTDSLAVFAGAYTGTATVKEVTGHPDFFVYFDAGTKVRVTPIVVVEVLLRENPFPGRGTTDVTIHIALTTTFGLQ